MSLSLTSDKVQLIFINPNDSYYNESMFVSDILQHIWIELHLVDYVCAYYLSASPSGFLISDFGDLERKSFSKKLIGGIKVADSNGTKTLNTPNAKDFRTCVLPEWDKQKAAVVCSLNDFYSAVRSNEWKEAFATFISNKSGNATLFLLVAPGDEKLLNSNPILSLIDDNDLIHRIQESGNAADMGIKEYLRIANARNCTFWDELDYVAVKEVLVTLAIQDSQKFESSVHVDSMAQFLSLFLTNNVPESRFGFRRNIANRKDCYLYLKNNDNWNRLIKNSEKFLNLDRLFDDKHISPSLANYITEDGEKIGDMVSDIRMLLKVNRQNDQTDVIHFCLISIINEWDQYSNNYETSGLIFEAFRTYLRYLDIEHFGYKNSRKILATLSDYLNLIYLSKAIYGESGFFDSYSSATSVFEKTALDYSKATISVNKETFNTQKAIIRKEALAISNLSITVNEDFVKKVNKAVNETKQEKIAIPDYPGATKIVTEPKSEVKVTPEIKATPEIKKDPIPIPSDQPTNPVVETTDSQDDDDDDIDISKAFEFEF